MHFPLKHHVTAYNVSYLLDVCKINAEKIKNTHTIRKRFSNFIQSEIPFPTYKG